MADQQYCLMSMLCLIPRDERDGLVHMAESMVSLMRHFTPDSRKAYIDISDVRPGEENVFLNIIARQHSKAAKILEAGNPLPLANIADPFNVLTTLTHGRN